MNSKIRKKIHKSYPKSWRYAIDWANKEYPLDSFVSYMYNTYFKNFNKKMKKRKQEKHQRIINRRRNRNDTL